MILAWTSAHSHLGQTLLELVVADDTTGQHVHVTADPALNGDGTADTYRARLERLFLPLA